MLRDDQAKEVLETRALSPEVYRYKTDGVERYASVGDLEELLERHSHPNPQFHGRLLQQSPGLVINRWDLDGNRLPSYLRFDRKIVTDARKPGHLTRYVYAAKHERMPAKVIDVHPLARPYVSSEPAEIYLCLEGCLKADALLSQPEREGKAVISVPSVTLWKVSRRRFAPYRRTLRRADKVWVVPDSDYLLKGHSHRDGRPLFINPQVRIQSDRAVSWLREQGINAEFCVPPYFSSELATEHGIGEEDRFKIGIDDLLQAGGNLRPWHARANPLGVHRFAHSAYEGSLPQLVRQRQGRADPRDEAFLRWLTKTHGTEGFFSPGEAARALDVDRNTIYNARKSLEERGCLSVWIGKPVFVEELDGWRSEHHLFRVRVHHQAKGLVQYSTLFDLRKPA